VKPAVEAAISAAPTGGAQLADVAQMWSMITGFWVSQLVGAAARLSLADHLARGAGLRRRDRRARVDRPGRNRPAAPSLRLGRPGDL
jgi:hypothetical protein